MAAIPPPHVCWVCTRAEREGERFVYRVDVHAYECASCTRILEQARRRLDMEKEVRP